MTRQHLNGHRRHWAAWAIVILIPSLGWAAAAIQAKRPAPPFLGVTLGQTERNELGVMIREVTSDGPAAKAGVKVGDRITKIDNQDMQNITMFMQTMEAKKPGDKLTLHVIREGKEQDIAVTVGERPQLPDDPLRQRPGGELQWRHPAFIGVQTMPLTLELKNRLQIKADTGVVIVDVSLDSPAAKAGIKHDDVVTDVNGTKIQDPPQLRDIIQQNGIDKEATVQISRGNEQLTLKVRPSENAFAAPGIPWRSERFPMDLESLSDSVRKIRELERRIDDLEKRVRELEGKKAPPPG
jgi:S1-C subfamily serine protease